MATTQEIRDRLKEVRAADAQVASEREARRVSRAAKPKVPNQCLCGCGTDTMSRFAPGHDAKLKSRLLNQAHGEDNEKAEEALQMLDELGWAKFFVPRTKPESKSKAAAA